MAPTPTTTTHPLVELGAARAEALAAVGGYRMLDLLRPGIPGECWSASGSLFRAS